MLSGSYYKNFLGTEFFIDFRNWTIINSNNIKYRPVFWLPVLKLEISSSLKNNSTHCIPLYTDIENKYDRILLTEDEAAEIEYDIKQYQQEWLDKNRELIEEY